MESALLALSLILAPQQTPSGTALASPLTVRIDSAHHDVLLSYRVSVPAETGHPVDH
jgi:hypothetical protein